jgi:tetratricopeptide (TPR) repeat protein
LVLEKLPLFALAMADCWMTLHTHAGAGTPLAPLERIGNAAVACITYVAQLFYPVSLSIFYPAPPGGPPLWKLAGAIAILAIASAAAVIWRRRCPYLFVGWFWYLGMLSPVLGMVNIGSLAMADRYMYLPGVGLYIALGWGAARLAAGSPAGHWVLGTCAGLVIAALVACAAWQTSLWRDDETLWTHALACTADNGEAELGLANALAHQGRLDEAIARYHRALALAADSGTLFDAHLNLGVALNLQSDLDEAAAQLRQALALVPDSYDAHVDLGGVLMRQQQLKEAAQHFRRAIEIDPLRVNAHGALAHALLQDGNVDEARAEFEQAVAADRHNPPAQKDLGQILFDQGKIDEAIPHFEAALAANPNFLRAHLSLAKALAAQGKLDGAIAHYRRALEIDPNDPVARQSLDKLLRDNAELLIP